MSCLYLFTALYCEAHMFIEHFHLEKNQENSQFQEFYNETAGIRLTVTGVGEIAAATAVGSICTKYRPKETDVLLNIGTCAHMAGCDGIYLCNKIVEQATGKTFYPDILYRHDFREEAVVTGMKLYHREETSGAGKCFGTLYDMEAAAVYQAGSYFFGPHQMIFVKIVSDKGDTKEVTANRIEQLTETYRDVLCDFIQQLSAVAYRNRQGDSSLQKEQEAFITKLCTDLHCSKTMSDSLRQHIRYLSLTGTDFVSLIQGMYGEGLLPCKDKKEGKLRFEELKRRLF